jgi:thiol-disulfide isomerase/thioredoxin
MTVRRLLWPPALALAGLLVGCSGGQHSGSRANPSAPAATTSPSSSPESPSASKLRAAKKSARIADCPASDQQVTKRPHGLPDVRLSCLGGGRSVRLAGLRGKPMMLTVWAQWCIPCRKEAPYVAKAAHRAGDNITVLGIDYNDPKPVEAIELAAAFGWHFPQLADRHKKIASSLKLLGPPVTLFVDKHGEIVHRHSGPYTSYTQVRQAVRKHLETRL